MSTFHDWAVAALIIGGGIIQPAAFLAKLRFAPAYGIGGGLMVLAIGLAYTRGVSAK